MENDEPQKEIQHSNDTKEEQPTENFQKFIHELFEKNGVLNDLRAYLRSHIVNVLKNVQTGDTIMCQKQFTQRLEPTFQALNMLIVEYFLRLDFSYSLSVFISEIPLANMVFDLATCLLLASNTHDSIHKMRFKDSDVWQILNFIGIKCDSQSASNIVEMYRKEQQSLLLCILRCISLYQKQPEPIEDENICDDSGSDSSRISNIGSSMSIDRKSEPSTRCKHYAFCKCCQWRFKRIRRKYKWKKSQIQKMFEQLKTVHEAEVEMVREEEERKIKRSLANHALLLQKRYDEMEESFKAREAELQNSVQEKKEFLWGLARALRAQHSNMASAMKVVKSETERLTAKEESLKSQIIEAEQTLRKRGDDMQTQISNELIILEGHLNSMRKERDILDRERVEIEKLKEFCEITRTNYEKEREKLRSSYDMLKDELLIMKNTLISSKCVVERGVMTDSVMSNITLNNEQELDKNVKSEESVRTPHQVVNDLKKRKNVNFEQSNLEEMVSERKLDRCRSRSSTSCEATDNGDLLLLLREENERLRTFADQQGELIAALSREQTRLRSELAAPRPRTAPAAIPTNNFFGSQGVNPSGVRNFWGWRKGAGEELSVFAEAQPRILVPGDTMPFVGVLTDRHADSRRHLINQWRSLRRRFSPIRVNNPSRAHIGPPTYTAPRPVSPAAHSGTSTSQHLPQPELLQPAPEGEIAGDRMGGPSQQDLDLDVRLHQRPEQSLEINKTREKSPKSVLREAKQKLRNKDRIKHQPSTTSREKSPSSTLREAKLRLRKLEIEAEAVEKSYLDFRRRRSELRGEELSMSKESDLYIEGIEQNLHIQKSSTFLKCDETHKRNEKKMNIKVSREFLKKDFDKYLRDYQSKYDFFEPQVANKDLTALKINSIPNAHLKLTQELENANMRENINYLETPLTEFRKLYHNPKSVRRIKTDISKPISPVINFDTELNKIDDQLKSPTEIQLEAISQTKAIDGIEETDRLEELKTYEDKKDSISLTEDHVTLNKESISNNTNINNNNNKNLLKVEIEHLSETQKIKIEDLQDDIMIVVQSSIDSRQLSISQDEVKSQIPLAIVLSPKKDSPISSIGDKSNKIQHVDKVKDCSLTENVKSPQTNVRGKSPEQTEISIEHSILQQNRSNGSDCTGSGSGSQEKAATRNDMLDVIFHTEPVKDVSSVDVGLNNTKDCVDSVNCTEVDVKDYPDDFSADVDNYNSHSELENSPISLPKTSEDDNFWD